MLLKLSFKMLVICLIIVPFINLISGQKYTLDDGGKSFTLLNPWLKLKYDMGWLPLDRELMKKEKFLLDVLRHVQQPLQSDLDVNTVDYYTYVDDELSYTNFKPVTEFFKLESKGLLTRDGIFSILNDKHLEETIGLFNLLYYSGNWSVFARNVLWARQHINPDMFVHALTVAVAHRDDCNGFVLPPLYEILPHKFVNVQTIRDAMNAKMQNLQKFKENITVMDRYTNEFEILNDESKLAYFIEDVGLNTYYYNNYVDRPFWLNTKKFKLNNDRRGELFLYLHQQLLARYYLERLSNHMGEINDLCLNEPIETGYNPQLCYPNGLGFSVRKNNYDISISGNTQLLNSIQDYERRIRDVIDTGYFFAKTGKLVDLRRPEAVNDLGNLIESNEDSINKNYFGMMTVLARLVLGGSYNANSGDTNYVPSVLEHYETALRDPVFYQLYKRILKNYFKFKDQLLPYTSDDLQCPSIKIEDLQVSPLITYFDFFDSDITNAVDVQGLGNGDLESPGKKKKKDKKKPVKKSITDPAWLEYVLMTKQMELDQMKQDLKMKKKEEKDKLKADKLKAQQMFLETKYKMLMDAINNAKLSNDDTASVNPDDATTDGIKASSLYQTILNDMNSFDVDDKAHLTLNDNEQFNRYQYDTDFLNTHDDFDVNTYGYDQYNNIMESVKPKSIKKRSLTSISSSSFNDDDSFTVNARQLRLNHEPFTFNLTVTSNEPQKVVFRVFLGPKYDNDGNLISFENNRDNFVELDQFLYNLPAGKSIIQGNSQLFHNTRKDFTSYLDLYKLTMSGIKGQTWMENKNNQCNFPDRLMLPMGWPEGLPMQLFVIVTPYTNGGSQAYQYPTLGYLLSSTNNGLCGIDYAKSVDNRPYGFPFDRNIDEDELDMLSNIFVKDVLIYHVKTDVPSLSTKPTTNDKPKKKKIKS